MVATPDAAGLAEFLTLTEAAALAGVHRNTVRGWCESGRLPSVRAPRRGERRVRRGDLRRLMAGGTDGVSASTTPAGKLTTPGRRRLDPDVRAEALRRMTADVSRAPDLPTLFEDVLDESAALFGVERAGLWLYDGSRHPFKLATARGLPDDLLEPVAALDRDDQGAAGARALRSRRVLVYDARSGATSPALREAYRRTGIASVCFVPVVFHDEPVALLALYHDQPYDWTDEEIGLAASFADAMAAAIANARLAASSARLTRQLDAIRELALRLNRLQDVTGIGETIVAEAGQLLQYDTIGVYRVDERSGDCIRIAAGRGDGARRGRAVKPWPSAVLIGRGEVGVVAARNEPHRRPDPPRRDRAEDPAIPSHDDMSLLVVPMSFEDRVRGVIALARSGPDPFTDIDESTLAIFAGYAAQSLVNAATIEQVRHQRGELAHQLASQRRLLEVNERLLSTLDPSEVLGLIADTLKSVVTYDSLTIYRVDREAGLRRAVVARDRFAELIMEHALPLEAGLTGWCIERGEAVLSNDAHLDERTVQIPGTPPEPESMIVVPLHARGEVIGTLNLARMGGPESHFSSNEFELTKLFAGQASIALHNAEVHGAVRVRVDLDSLTGLRNHGAFQRELDEALAGSPGPLGVLMMDLDGFKVFNDRFGHPAGDAFLAGVAEAMSAGLAQGDRLYRYGGDEFAAILPGADHARAHEVAEQLRRAVAGMPREAGAPAVSISVGVACHPEDGRTKDALVAAADQALYLLKPGSRMRPDALAGHGGYLDALDETTVAVMSRLDPTTLLETTIVRAARLLGTSHGYIYLVDDDEQHLSVRVGIGLFEDFLGYRLPVEAGLGGLVYRTGQPFAVDDYDAYAGRSADMPSGRFGAVVGVPLAAGGKVVGVIGLAAGNRNRRFGEGEIAALSRFAQLASIALDNARLAEAARRGMLYDRLTGLPNRELLTDRIAHAMSGIREDRTCAVMLLGIDRFEVVNESVGHAGGDRLLALIARRLTGAVRPGDTVARFGGDEFAIIVDPVVDAGAAAALADRIADALATPFQLEGRDWFVSASIGIAVAAGSAAPDDVLREAQVALARAKADGALRQVVFDPSMSVATLERLELENGLRRALERGELAVHYQPIIDLQATEVRSLEALVRWAHPTRGLIPPLAFISLAEEMGLVSALGGWVLETASRQARAWRGRFPDLGLSVSVNLSATEFAQPDLPSRVASILAATGLPAEALELEITESIVMDQSQTGLRALHALRDLGVTLVLDDFGTGYSSLSYLRHLPLDRLKIDRSFVTNIDQDPTNRSIVEAVIALGHGLGMRVVAEGIERQEEATALRALGCDLGQGYLWARPAPAAAMTQVLRRWQGGGAAGPVARGGERRRMRRPPAPETERAGPKAGSMAAS